MEEAVVQVQVVVVVAPFEVVVALFSEEWVVVEVALHPEEGLPLVAALPSAMALRWGVVLPCETLLLEGLLSLKLARVVSVALS